MEQHQLTGPPVSIPLHYAPAQRGESRWGKGFLAVCGTFVFAGLGHWIAGAPRRAIGWFLVYLATATLTLISFCVARLQSALLLLVPIQLLLVVAVYIDAFMTARRSHRPMLGLPWRRYLAGILILILGGFTQSEFTKILTIIVTPHAEAFVTRSRAMAPTLVNGDRFLTIKSFDVHRWDVVAFNPPAHPNMVYVNRVVGLPGETVELIAGKVNINGVPLNPPGSWGPYQSTLPPPRIGNGCQGHPITLGGDEYYLLGDNSPIAGDARYWSAAPHHQPGAVSRGAIVAKVTRIYWPPSRWRKFP
jgi:signal peptidase I